MSVWPFFLDIYRGKIHIHSYTNWPMPFQGVPILKNCYIFASVNNFRECMIFVVFVVFYGQKHIHSYTHGNSQIGLWPRRGFKKVTFWIHSRRRTHKDNYIVLVHTHTHTHTTQHHTTPASVFQLWAQSWEFISRCKACGSWPCRQGWGWPAIRGGGRVAG